MPEPSGTSSSPPHSFFVPDGTGYLPTTLAGGPWGPALAGNYVGGLLGRAVEQAVDDDDLQPTRLTVDLLRPVALQPVHLRTTVVREGRRLRVVDAVMMQNDVLVARASSLFLRRSESPENEVWTSPLAMPEVPGETSPMPDGLPMVLYAYGRDPVAGSPGVGTTEWRHDGPKFAWLKETKTLVDGEALTPFVRAAMAGDVTSSLTHWGTTGLHYINADYTLTLSRLPVDEYIGLAALTHYGHDGIATGVATLFDAGGPIGSGVATAVVNPGFAIPRR